MRSTYASITTENRLVRDPDEKLMMLEPNEAALTTLLMALKRKKTITTPRIEHFDDDFIAGWVAASAQTNANASSTTITLSDGSTIVVGDTLLVPSGSSSNHEMVRVTAKPSANVCTVVRNVGATGLLTITSGAGLMRLGQAFEEGSASPTARFSTPSTVTNYTQIFKMAIEISGTDANSRQYANDGDERKRMIEKAAKEFKIQMNKAFYWGKPSEDLTGGPSGVPIRTTGGIDHHITTNRYDVANGGTTGVLTKKGWETFARMAFRYGTKRVLLASPLIISAIHEWGNGFLKLEPGSKEYGVDITNVHTGHGLFMLVKDWELRDGVSGQYGFGGYAFSLDLNAITRRVLTGRDTKIEKDVQANDEDKHKDMLICECGLQVQQEEHHARIYGVTDYSA